LQWLLEGVLILFLWCYIDGWVFLFV